MALCGLAAGLVVAQLARLDLGRCRWANPRLDAGMAYIERRWSDPELNAEAVVAHLGGARTALYSRFIPLGGIDAAIRQRRLDHALRALLSGAEPDLPMGQFALRHGFRSEINLTRAFQARFGETPKRFRRQVALGDRAWLAEQAGRAGFGSLQAWLVALATGARGEGEAPRAGGVGPRPCPRVPSLR